MTTTGGAPPLPRPDEIPAPLRERAQWVAWRYVTRKGKRTKVPVNPHTGGAASTTDPATWGTLDQALAFARRHRLGVGYVFSADDPFVGIDGDGYRDPEEGTLTPEAYALLARLDTYAEVSASGTGIHLICEARKPGARCRHAGRGLEVYDHSRLFAFTGQYIAGFTRIMPRQAEVDDLYAELWPEVEAAPAPPPPLAGPCSVDAAAVLRLARLDPRHGVTFARVYDAGDWEACRRPGAERWSPSEARAWLHNELTYQARGDVAIADDLFVRSAIFDAEKWPRERDNLHRRSLNRANWYTRDDLPRDHGRGASPLAEPEAAAPEPTPIYEAPSADPAAELARLRAENADLRRQLGECSRRREAEVAHWRERFERERAEKAAVVRDQRIFREALRNQDCKAEVRGGLAVALQIREQMNNHPEQYAVRDRETGEQFWIVNYSMAGRQVGLSSDQVGKAVKLLARQGKLRTKRLRTRGPRRNPDTGEVEEGYITPICISIDADPMEWVARELAPLEKAPDPETGEVKKHGGKRCPRCGSGKTRVVTRICLDCGHQFAGETAAEDEDDPDAALNPHLAGLEEPPPPVVVVPIGPQDADLEPATLNRQDADSGQRRPLPRCLSVSRGCQNRVERAGDEYCHKCVEKGYRNLPRAGGYATTGGYQATGA